MTRADFIDWLDAMLREKEMSRADLARSTGLSPAQITRLMNGEQGPGLDTIVLLARAIGKTPEEVFRRSVGITKPERDPASEEVAYLMGLLSDERKQQIVDYVRFIAQSDLGRGK